MKTHSRFVLGKSELQIPKSLDVEGRCYCGRVVVHGITFIRLFREGSEIGCLGQKVLCDSCGEESPQPSVFDSFEKAEEYARNIQDRFRKDKNLEISIFQMNIGKGTVERIQIQ